MGKLFLVSAGPGSADLLTPRAQQAIRAVSDLVSYGLYLDLLGELCVHKTRHELPLGEETRRAELALDLAAAGKPTALISSGDIGVYAMATLVFELLDNELRGANGNPDWLQVDIEVVPGITAMQVASSRVGALLGHDFCAISLSDLLTPWETITKRIDSAAAGDFVISFYNPVSRKRSWQLNEARDVLLRHRPDSTPVVLARNLTRADESIDIITLAKLDAADVDMFTLVSIGNSETRHIVNNQTSWVYTPRGYANKIW